MASSLPSLLMQAAQSAAKADGVVPPEGKQDEAADAIDAAAKVKSEEGQGSLDTKAPAQGPYTTLTNNSATLNQLLSNMNGANPDASVDPSSAQAVVAAAAQAQQQAALEQATQAAQLQAAQQASASAVAAPSPPSSAAASETKKSERAPLRRGKWTPEEEAYANRLIQEFKAGLLPLTDGTTLRTFLSKLLNCDPMRISKKFVGSNCIGKQVFRRRGADISNLTPDEIERTRFELSELEKKFLDRVAQNKGSKGSGGGSKRSRRGGMSSSGGGLGSLNSNVNKSTAAVGRALLQGGNKPSQTQSSTDTLGLMAQLQAQNPGMVDGNSVARSLLSGSQAGLGSLGNLATNASITNLMLQTGMSRDQISQLAAKGISSSASLANLLGKQRSFDQLMSLDFQSMQSIDNLANLIQAGMPNQASGLGTRVPKAQMKNMDWGTQGVGAAGLGNVAAPTTNLLSAAAAGGTKNSLENLVRTLSANAMGAPGTAAMANQANASNFGNLLQNSTQNNPLASLAAAGQAGGANNLGNIIQTLQQQNQQQQAGSNTNMNLNLLQGMAGSLGGGSGQGLSGLLQSNNANVGSAASLNQTPGMSNSLLNILANSSGGSLTQTQNMNPLMQQLTANAQFGGNALQNAATGAQSNQGNPMLAALAQQQLLAQAGGNNNMNSLLGQQAGLHQGFGALGGNFGNLGGSLGGLGNANFGSATAPAAGNQQDNTAALLQQLLAQSGGAAQAGAPGLAQSSGGQDDGAGTSGTKRSLDEVSGGDEDESNKKQAVGV